MCVLAGCSGKWDDGGIENGGRVVDVPTGSPMGASRPPEPFDSSCFSSWFTGIWSWLSLAMLICVGRWSRMIMLEIRLPVLMRVDARSDGQIALFALKYPPPCEFKLQGVGDVSSHSTPNTQQACYVVATCILHQPPLGMADVGIGMPCTSPIVA